MKLIYSHLKKFLPDLNVEPQKLRDDLTMIGHFANYYEKISDTDFVVDLDIKVNRGDALGYYGLARDLSVLYNIPISAPDSSSKGLIHQAHSSVHLPITITSPDVRRVMSVKISGVKVSPSPQWLVDFLKYHNINSINNIVDLTNYVMFMYGIPNHAFDAQVSTDNLIWENNQGKTKEFVTLAGTTLNLYPENLVISNQKEVLSTDLVGGKKSGITDSTTDLIIEVAVYDRTRIRKDSKLLKTVTEAGTRLEKDLDANLIPTATNLLIDLIIQEAGGQVDSQLFDYYPHQEESPSIEFDTSKPSIYSGIEVPHDFAVDVLTRLGCNSTGLINQTLSVQPPTIRKDITLEEDLTEEVVRFWGYQKIPTDQPLVSKEVPDITPPNLYLIEFLKDNLVDLGYDEIRSWPLVRKESVLSNLTPKDTSPIYTQNSINEEYPVLRTSIISSLKSQQDQYQRFKVPTPQFFEIGKVFYQDEKGYKEHYALGLYHWNQQQLSADLESIFDSLKSSTGNIQSHADNTGFYAEINLDELVKSLDHSYLQEGLSKVDQNRKFRSYELNSQIITLDANITYEQEQDPLRLITEYTQKIGECLWQLIITDIYHDPKTDKYRYTFRASYFNLDDKQAKELHLKSFNLSSSGA